MSGEGGWPVPVSVVIPAFNAERWLRRAVESALADVVDEVVVVDDASRDGTSAVAEELAARDNRVTLLRLPQNSGARIARQEGARCARNPWLAPLDSDDYFEHGAVSDAYFQVVRDDSELCIWTMHRVDETGEDFVWPDLSILDFPMTGREAARLTLGEWRIHPLGVVARQRFLRAAEGVSVQSFNSDELVTRLLLISLRKVSRSKASYFYVRNRLSTTLKSPPDLRHLARSQAWLLAFARRNGYFHEEPLLAHGMIRDSLLLAEQVAALHPEESLEGLIAEIRRSRPPAWRIGAEQGCRTAVKAILGRGDGKRLRALGEKRTR